MGKSDSQVVEHILPLDLEVKVAKGERAGLHFSNGGAAIPNAYQLYNQTLKPGSKATLSAGGGRPSDIRMPWYNLQWSDGGLLVAIGWSGQWVSQISRQDSVSLQAGMQYNRFRLHAGEELRTPRIVLTRWSGSDVFRGYNIGRHLLIAHYLRQIQDEIIFPPVSKNAEYEFMDMTNGLAGPTTHGEENQLEVIREAAKLGVEVFWLDAHWFKGDFPFGVGNWQFPIKNSVRSSFPRGLRPLGDEAHQEGMKFILWYEPERVSAGTYVDREKRSWVIQLPKTNQRLFNLGLPEAREWMTRYLIESLKAFNVDICRVDFNIDPLPYWLGYDGADRRGVTEIRYVQGLYAMWDEIIRGKAGIWIDNCASGGRRIDIETCSRSIPLWRSDFNDNPKHKSGDIPAIADQVMTMGLSLYVPFHSGPVWRPEPYYWRSAMSAGNVIDWDIRPNPRTAQYDYNTNLTKKAVRECQSLRPYYLGDYYPLTRFDTDPRTWVGYEYVRPAEGDGFAVFFRRPESSQSSVGFELREIDLSKRYVVEWYWTYEKQRSATLPGFELAHFHGEIHDEPGSLLIRFRRVD
jgi:alpha-galactosidase